MTAALATLARLERVNAANAAVAPPLAGPFHETTQQLRERKARLEAAYQQESHLIDRAQDVLDSASMRAAALSAEIERLEERIP